MNKWFLLLSLVLGHWLSRTAVAQSQLTSHTDSNPFATPTSLFGPAFGSKKISAKDSIAAVEQLCYGNGWERLRRGDNVGAAAEFSRLIQLRPAFGRGYTSRATARRKQRDLIGAVADCARAIEVDPDDPYLYRMSAVTQMLARRWTEASADLQISCMKSGHDNGYAAVLLWIVRMRLEETDSANEGLATFFARSSEFDEPEKWVQHIGRFLLGRETEADLFTAASDYVASNGSNHRPWFTMAPLDAKPDTANGPVCEAWFYSGMKRLLAGDKETAANHFRQCLATKRVTFIEYELAEAELYELER